MTTISVFANSRKFANIFALFRDSSAVERSPVKRLVAGSNPAPGAKKLDTNSFFEDETVRSPSLAIGGTP